MKQGGDLRVSAWNFKALMSACNLAFRSDRSAKRGRKWLLKIKIDQQSSHICIDDPHQP